MYKLLFFFLLFSTLSLSQKQSECEQILSKEMVFNFDDKAGMENFINEVYSLSNCGLDSSDIGVFLKGPVLGTILVGLSTQGDTVLTYQVLYDKFDKLLNSEDYKYQLEFLKVSNELSKRPADINNWKEDSLLLDKLLISDELINNIYDFLKGNSDPNKSYKDVFRFFAEIPPSVQEATMQLEDIFHYSGNANYEDLLQKSIELNKPLLLLFTGYNCVNCRKMEAAVLFNQSIKNQLKNEFHFVSLYVDDNEALPQSEWEKSERNGGLIRFIGDKHYDLQFKLTNSLNLPCFVIIDKNGIKVEQMGFTKSTEEFSVFLTGAK